MIDGKKLVNYLAHGIQHSQIAIALNITQGRVAQLAQEPKIAAMVEEKKKSIAEADVCEIADMKSIKATLLERMADLAHGTDSLNEAINTYEKLEKLTATKMGKDGDDNGVRQIIMNAPIFIQQNLSGQVELDSNRRIVSIRDRSMAQMPTEGVRKILEGAKANDPQANDSQAENSARLDLSEFVL